MRQKLIRKILTFFYLTGVEFLLLTIFAKFASAQVVINEFSSFDNPGDWVEVLNIGIEPIDLSNYRIRDSSNTQKVDLFGTLNSQEFAVFDLKDYLNKSGDIISLFHLMNGEQDLEPVMRVCYGDKVNVCERIKVGCYPESGSQSIGSYPSDGGNTFERFSNHAKNASNTNAQLYPCPTPTPEPTKTPAPTPKPISTPTATNTPTPTAKVEGVKTTITQKNPEEGIHSENARADILGIRNTLEDEESKIESEGVEKKKFPILAGLLMVGGLGFIGTSFYLFLKNKKEGYNLKNAKGDES